MNETDCTIIRTMYHADGTNWTPLAVSERMEQSREYVKTRTHTLAADGALKRVSRGLYRVPRN